MKKVLFILTTLSLLSSSCLAIYTLTGNVYYQWTTTGVPNATVTLTGPGCSASATTDIYGSFMVQCSGDMSGSTMILTAQAPGGSSGQITWQVPQNTTSQYKKVYVAPTLQIDPSLNLQPMPAHWTGAGPTFNSQVYLKSTVGIVHVQNAVIDISFDNSIQNVVSVEPSPWIAPALILFNWDSPPDSGLLHIDIEFHTPLLVDEFPAESFFDVMYEVEVPEDDAALGTVSVDNAIFSVLLDPEPQISTPPCLTEYLVGEPAECQPYFLLDELDEWLEVLNAEWPQANISPMTPAEWNEIYMPQWQEPEWREGEPYPENEFLPSELYVYEGDDDPASSDPDDAGLVMAWGPQDTPTGDYSSAWKWDYGLDPDLSNAIVKVTVTAPQFGPSGQVNAVSFGIQDVNGNVRSWWWTCSAAGPIVWGIPTTVTIDTSKIGTSATNPPASGFTNNPAFDIKQSQFFIVDENFQWIFGSQPVPPPGQTQFGVMWNYWHNISVTLKQPEGTADSKWYVKYSQPPVEIEDLIDGWDQYSQYYSDPQMGTIFSMATDDWICEDDRPVTDIHWWGSYIGWTQPYPPPQVPDYFKICIWTDIPQNVVGPDGLQTPYSRPLKLLWEHDCYKWVWNFAGYDLDPRWQFLDYPEYDQPKLGDPQENEACFQFTQLLDQDDWFHQEPMEVLADGTVIPNVYWISIAAVYLNTLPADVKYPWGWKTRPYDPAVAPDTAGVINDVDVFPFMVNSTMVNGFFPLVLPDPDQYPGIAQYDLAFELTTNEPKCPGLRADLNDDCIVNLPDLAIMAQEWLLTSP